MRPTRPTLVALEELPSEQVPDHVANVLARARAAGTRESKWAELSQLRLYGLRVPLLRNADRRFADGDLPDQHRTSSKRLGFPVYEVRDRTGAAYRGAVVRDTEGDPWLVFAAPHDRFHGVAAGTLAKRHSSGTLLPRALDVAIRDEEEAEEREHHEQQGLLLALVNALEQMLATGTDVVLDTTSIRLPTGSIKVACTRVPVAGWEPAEAHEHAEIYTVMLSLSDLPYAEQRWAIGLIARFLATDQEDIELVPGPGPKQVAMQAILTHAELIQILADRSATVYARGDLAVPPPTELHYADRFAITRAFVQGAVIRAVCGEWFIPRGDDRTHDHLPVCAACEGELPAARAIRDLLRGRS